ncbi:MAG: DUF885 domain-containing protein [Acidobacteria bacterium]|nr:DUF885 domain-containing protein [Acidobacteriota bacterium]
MQNRGHWRTLTQLSVLAVLAGIPLAASWPRPPGGDPASARVLHQLADDYWKQRTRDPGLADVSLDRARQGAEEARSLLDRLAAVRSADLTHEDWLTWSILKNQLEQTVNELETYWFQFSVTAQSNVFLRTHRVFERHPFNLPADLATYRERLGEYSDFVARMEAKLAGQAERGIRLPGEAIGPIVETLTQYIRDPAESPFSVADARLARIESAAAESFTQEVARTIVSTVNPALTRLVRFLDGPLRREAPKTVGLGQYPGGKEAYARLVRRETTLEVTPEEVHRIGLREVATLEQKMAEVRARLGFTGSKAEFHRVLRTDARFYPNTPAEIGDRLMKAIDRITPTLGGFFLRFPKAPYAIKRLNPALEGSMTYGHYTVPTALDPSGYYFYNGSNLDQRSLLNAASLAYHEIMPGHHFQMAQQLEMTALPEFRRRTFPAGFVEGWAEYVSSAIAAQAGMYSDPYDLYGRLAWDALFSVRLVVDTGLNFYGWPRAKAMAYMQEHTLESDTQIDSETLRYAVGSPAQALAYKLGSLKMFELRRKAEQSLGRRFDLRRFHDALVGSGAMPLPVLEQHVDWFIAQEKQGSADSKRLP